MSAAKLVLGTVQLGAPYGVANKTGMPDEDEAAALIRCAIDAGVMALDTARGYGESETRIGNALQGLDFAGEVITKLRPPEGFAKETKVEEVRAFVRSDIEASCKALRIETLDCVLLHRARHLTEWDGAIWQELTLLKEEGKVKRLGVSVQNVDETRRAIATKSVEHIQLAVSILDWRWKDAKLDSTLKERTDITVHARSVFLQGLLVAGDASLFPVLSEKQAQQTVDAITGSVASLNRKSAADLCLAYVRSHDWIDGIVVGMETLAQLEENLKLFEEPALTPEEQSFLEHAMPHLTEKLLSPGLWNK